LSEWCSKDTEPQIANPGLQEISEENAHPYIAPLANKKHHSTLVKNLEESFVKMALTGLGVQSVLTMPVFDGDVFWGLVCLQENRYERQWTPLETTILNLFGDSFTFAFQRFRNTERI
jgi:GAF domain-containing protein